MKETECSPQKVLVASLGALGDVKGLQTCAPHCAVYAGAWARTRSPLLVEPSPQPLAIFYFPLVSTSLVTLGIL